LDRFAAKFNGAIQIAVPYTVMRFNRAITKSKTIECCTAVLVLLCCDAMAAIDSPQKTGTLTRDDGGAATITSREVADALVSTNSSAAANVLVKLNCLTMDALVVTQVQRAWTTIGTSPPDSVTRNANVQSLMAKCILDATGTPLITKQSHDSALQYLRGALRSSRLDLETIAIVAIAPNATIDDVNLIRDIGLNNPRMATIAVNALLPSCLPDADLAVNAIRQKYANLPQIADIEASIGRSEVKKLRELCRAQRVSPIDSGASNRMKLSPDVSDIREALDSSNARNALKVIIDLHCSQTGKAQVDEVRRAWRERAAPNATAAMRDPSIQAVMAECLIEARATPPPSNQDVDAAVTLLRTAVTSDDPTEALVASIGLIHLSEARDIQSIVNFTHRFSYQTVPVVMNLSTSCGPNAAPTIQAMLDQAPNRTLRDRIDAIYTQAAQRRRAKCAGPNP
jgi:hypothetical protein